MVYWSYYLDCNDCYCLLGLKKNSPKWSKNKYNKNLLLYFQTKRNYCTSSNSKSPILGEFLEDIKLNPIFWYENLHLDNVKKELKMQTKGLSGVYLILNKITLDYYVGSASTDKFYARFSNHFTILMVVK